MTHIWDRVNNTAPHLDKINVVFGVLVFVFTVGGIVLLNGSAAIALVTALTAWMAIYRLRRPDETRPSVRQTFAADEDGGLTDFGLRNYGPGAALYLQIIVVRASSGETLLEMKPREHPLHLAEGEFLGFIYDDRVADDRLLKSITDTADYEEPDEVVEIYYSYVSSTGLREPEEVMNETERADETILPALKERCQKPRRMELERIQRHCSRKIANPNK